MSNLPTSEIAVLAIDSVATFYWFDRFAKEQPNPAPLASLPALIPSPPHHPLQTVLTALRSFRRSHHPITVIVNQETGFTGSVRSAFQLCKRPSPTLEARDRLFPESSDGTHLFLTHQITLNLARVAPSPHSVKGEQRTLCPSRRVDVHVQVKTGEDHAESLLMQIKPDRVVIIMPDDAYPPDSEEE
jgi:hypothetical protein